MAVRTRRLGQTNAAGGGAGATVTIFTCPADRTAIVKELRQSLGAGGAPPYALVWEVSFSGGAFRRVARADLTAVGVVVVQEAWFVLQETDVLRVSVPAGATVFAMASGTLLDGDPA